MPVEKVNLTDSDLDLPLYRIFRVEYFEDALRTRSGNLALVPPMRWEDPQEDLAARMQMTAPDLTSKMLHEYLQPTYAQCWSLDGRSDTLLRAYSRVRRDPVTNLNVEFGSEGVKVQTTPRLIIAALDKFLTSHHADGLQFFVAKVRYVDDPAAPITKRLQEIGPTKLGGGRERAVSLTYKRRLFEHEQEVRVIAVTPRGPSEELFLVNIDPNEVFETISFDPRITRFECIKREEIVTGLGYSGKIVSDNAYQGRLIDLCLPVHWDVLDARQTPTPGKL
jgi:hypothetical protein